MHHFEVAIFILVAMLTCYFLKLHLLHNMHQTISGEDKGRAKHDHKLLLLFFFSVKIVNK